MPKPILPVVPDPETGLEGHSSQPSTHQLHSSSVLLDLNGGREELPVAFVMNMSPAIPAPDACLIGHPVPTVLFIMKASPVILDLETGREGPHPSCVILDLDAPAMIPDSDMGFEGTSHEHQTHLDLSVIFLSMLLTFMHPLLSLIRKQVSRDLNLLVYSFTWMPLP